MSEDWQVVEEALKNYPAQGYVAGQPVGSPFLVPHAPALAALARLREREANFRRNVSAALDEQEEYWAIRVAELKRERDELLERDGKR